MIKKILSTMLVSSVLLVFSTFSSIADRPTIAIGGSVNYGGYVASGTENEGVADTFSGREHTDDTAAMEVGYSSVFFEINMKDRLTLGVEYMAAEVETDTASRTDNPEASQSTSTDDTGTSSVQVQFSDMVTAYAELRILNGMYAKLGTMQIDVKSKELLHTNSSYGDVTLDGITYGIGYKNSWDNGFFLKTETMMHDWDNFSLTATSNDTGSGSDKAGDPDVTNTKNANTVDGNIDGAILSIRIGKAF